MKKTKLLTLLQLVLLIGYAAVSIILSIKSNGFNIKDAYSTVGLSMVLLLGTIAITVVGILQVIFAVKGKAGKLYVACGILGILIWIPFVYIAAIICSIIGNVRKTK